MKLHLLLIDTREAEPEASSSVRIIVDDVRLEFLGSCFC